MIASLKNLVKRSLAKRRSRGLQLGSGARISQGRFGAHVRIGGDAVVLASAIGDYSYLGDRTSLAHAQIGRFCSIGPDVTVGSGTHPSRDWVSTHPIFYQARPALGWTLTLHDGGVPARLIRYRFDADQIALLLSLRWWNRDLAWLRENAPAFAHVNQLREAMRHG